jgi:hypothetical protein
VREVRNRYSTEGLRIDEIFPRRQGIHDVVIYGISLRDELLRMRLQVLSISYEETPALGHRET